MAQRTLLVLNIVGLTPSLIGTSTPNLLKLRESGFQAELGTVLPAVTCSAQATMLTGRPPAETGIVGNGWYFRDLAEVWFWRQSNHLVHGERIWERCRREDPSFTCAKLFFWYNMYSSADWSVTPRPAYPADGRKLPDVYSHPPQLRDELTAKLGPFPLFQFWGPGAGLASTEWIGAAAQHVVETRRPRLTLVYLPHLDYDLQRFGPSFSGVEDCVRAVDRIAGELIDLARRLDMEVLAVSEYGITPVQNSVSLNRVLRRAGWLAVHQALNGELLDAGASRAFAVCDHQVAHVYVREPENVPAVAKLLQSTPGVEQVLDDSGKTAAGLNHPRAGELVAVAERNSWFDYYYWLDDTHAPDFARTVDIHRKPGYDPVELLLDPSRPLVKAQVLGKLALRKLGFRTLLDVISLDASLIRGSHGRLPDDPAEGPVLISSSTIGRTERLEMREVPDLMFEMLFAG